MGKGCPCAGAVAVRLRVVMTRPGRGRAWQAEVRQRARAVTNWPMISVRKLARASACPGLPRPVVGLGTRLLECAVFLVAPYRCSVATIATDLLELDLDEVDPERLQAAVCAALEHQTAEVAAPSVSPRSLTGRLPSTQQLRVGAEETVKEDTDDAQAAEYFQSLLELGYLVASADGLASEEREALAKLVEQATGAVVEREAVERHFNDLGGGAEVLGRRERLARVASNIEDSVAREEAISFAALIAIADGKLTEPEARLLLELGEHFSFSEGKVKAVLGRVVDSIKLALKG